MFFSNRSVLRSLIGTFTAVFLLLAVPLIVSIEAQPIPPSPQTVANGRLGAIELRLARVEQIVAQRGERITALEGRMAAAEAYDVDLKGARLRDRLTIEEQRTALLLWAAGLTVSMITALLVAFVRQGIEGRRATASIHGALQQLQCPLSTKERELIAKQCKPDRAASGPEDSISPV